MVDSKEWHAKVLTGIMEYGHTKAKSQVLCGPNSNPLPNECLGVGYKGIVFLQKNGWIMENMDKKSQYKY